MPRCQQRRQRGVWRHDRCPARFLADDTLPAALLVSSEVGSGKTSLLARIAERRLRGESIAGEGGAGGTDDSDGAVDAAAASEAHTREAVLLVTGEQIAAGASLFGHVRHTLGLKGPENEVQGSLERGARALAEILAASRDGSDGAARPMLMLIDALNDAGRPGRVPAEAVELAEAVDALNRAAGKRPARCIISVRWEWVDMHVRQTQRQGGGGELVPSPLFACWPDARGERVPWLSVRRFDDAELRPGYVLTRNTRKGRGQAVVSAEWDDLPVDAFTYHRTPESGLGTPDRVAGVLRGPQPGLGGGDVDDRRDARAVHGGGSCARGGALTEGRAEGSGSGAVDSCLDGLSLVGGSGTGVGGADDGRGGVDRGGGIR